MPGGLRSARPSLHGRVPGAIRFLNGNVDVTAAHCPLAGRDLSLSTMKTSVHQLLPAMRPQFLVVILLAACATNSKPRIASDYDHTAQFSSLHKFTLFVRPHTGMSSSALTQQRTYDAIREQLAAKGFTYVADPAQADFAVDFSVGAQDRLEASSYPRYFQGPWGPGAWGNEVDVRQYQEGTLAIDVFDMRSQRAIWHGVAKKELSRSELEHSEGPIREAVSDVLAGFPPA